LDRATAAWLYGLDSVLQTAGRLDPDARLPGSEVGSALEGK
jgi:hypothetical protein